MSMAAPSSTPPLSSLRVDEVQMPRSAPLGFTASSSSLSSSSSAVVDPTDMAPEEMEDPNYKEFDYDNEDLDGDMGYLSQASFGHVGVTDGSTSLAGQSAPGLDGTARITAVKRTWGESIRAGFTMMRQTLRALFGLAAADPDELDEAYQRHLQQIAEEDREAAEIARIAAEQKGLLSGDGDGEVDVTEPYRDRDQELDQVISERLAISTSQTSTVSSPTAHSPISHPSPGRGHGMNRRSISAMPTPNPVTPATITFAAAVADST